MQQYTHCGGDTHRLIDMALVIGFTRALNKSELTLELRFEAGLVVQRSNLPEAQRRRSAAAMPAPYIRLADCPEAWTSAWNVLLGRIPLLGAKFLPQDLSKRLHRQRRILFAQNTAKRLVDCRLISNALCLGLRPKRI
jgi:hypothetical protein